MDEAAGIVAVVAKAQAVEVAARLAIPNPNIIYLLHGVRQARQGFKDDFSDDFFLYWVVISMLDCTLFAYFSANGWDGERPALPMDYDSFDTFPKGFYAKTQHISEPRLIWLTHSWHGGLVGFLFARICQSYHHHRLWHSV